MRILLRSPAHDLTVDVVRDAVSLVDPVPVTPSALARLTPYELALVYDWAIREHLRASDSAVERRPRPSCLNLAVVVSAFMEIARSGEDDRTVMSRFRAYVAQVAERRAASTKTAPSTPALVDPPVTDACMPTPGPPAPAAGIVVHFSASEEAVPPLPSSSSSDQDWSSDPACPQFRVHIDFTMRLPPGSPPPTPTLEAVDSAALAMAGPPFYLLPGLKIGVGRFSTRRTRRTPSASKRVRKAVSKRARSSRRSRSSKTRP